MLSDPRIPNQYGAYGSYLAYLEAQARGLENRRAAVAVYGDKTSAAYKALEREAEAAANAYYEYKAGTA